MTAAGGWDIFGLRLSTRRETVSLPLFLKAIEIYGFKTFPDKTRIEFADGVTAIIGPNGCGKSNILDAIRWGMGEQRLKSLRGESLEDILFNGSEKRDPAGVASVTLYLRNEDRLLPSEQDEVEVCRKYYRNGTSEFFLNRKPVLLKDIQSFFMDTGVGRNSYAFIQQSQVDILLDDHTSKRPIFEEAAGISKYKARRAEAQMKLERTRENLTRVADILEEVEKNMNRTRLQAETAEKAAKLDAEIKELEIRLLALEYREERERMLKEREREAKQRERNAQFEEELRRLEERIREARERLDRTKESRADSEKEIITLQGREAALGQRKDHLLAQVNENLRRDEEDRIRLASLETKRANALAKAAEVEERLKANGAELEAQKAALEAATAELGAVRGELEAVERETEGLRGRIQSLAQEVERTRRSLKEALDDFLQRMDGRKDELVSRHERRKELAVRIEGTVAAMAERLEEAGRLLASETPDLGALRGVFGDLRRLFASLRADHGELRGLEREVEGLIFDKEGLQGVREEIEGRIHAMEAEQVAAQNRIATLEDRRKALAKSEERLRSRAAAIQNRLARLQAERDGVAASLEAVRGQAKEYEDEIRRIGEAMAERARKNGGLKETIAAVEKEIAEVRERIKGIQRTVTDKGSDLKTISDRLEADQARLEEKKRQLKELEDRRRGFELNVREHATRMADLRQLMFENYGLEIEAQVERLPASAEAAPLKRRLQELKARRAELGHVNHMAVEEYREYQERHKHLSSQKRDIEKAEEDLKEVIRRINEESERVFLDTLKRIRERFVEVVRRLFHGGRADIVLVDPSDPLNSEVEVLVQPPGKKNKMSQLSGGEKSLAAIALVFAIFLTRPSPFCVLDEVEHALDEHNIRQFLGLLREFKTSVQFLIVTHNKQTMTAADVLYGVTMEEKTDPSVSKVVSLKLSEVDAERYQVREFGPAGGGDGP